jgi:hypothetical protein
MSETETSNDDLFRGFFTGMDDLIDVVPGQSTDVFSSSLISTKSGKKFDGYMCSQLNNYMVWRSK